MNNQTTIIKTKMIHMAFLSKISYLLNPILVYSLSIKEQ